MTPPRHHLASLDVFRGLAVAGMILVNNPGNWTTTFEALTHANGNGCTLADLVFPCFVFILGAAMPFAFARRGADRSLPARIVRRTAWLIVLGLALNAVAAAPHLLAIRVPGVLQRIGLIYLIAAPLVIYLRPGWRVVVLTALVVGHSLLLMMWPGAAVAVDRAVFGAHLLTPAGDPEGLLGTLPAVATALLGSIAGDWMRRGGSAAVRIGGLVAGGLAAATAGLIWSAVLPLNKALWTGSFVLFTGGVAALMLAACHLALDDGRELRWARPFLWLGVNPLAIYFLAEVAGHLLDRPWRSTATAATMTARAWIFWDVLSDRVPGVPDEWLSLAFAVLTVALWIGVAGALHRRGIRIRV